MKSELFVVNSVTTSERAFSAVAEHIPSIDIPALLRVLQNAGKLRQAATQMRVGEDQVFEHLEQAIIAAFSRRSVAQLTREHVRLLLNTDTQKLLSEVLHCSLQETLQTLFSVPALQDTLRYVTDGNISRLPTSATQLLNELLRPDRAQRLEFDYTTTENNWKPIVIGEEWLLPSSVTLLLGSAQPSSGVVAAESLAELIDKSQKDKADISANETDRSGARLGPLSLIEIRRRLFWATTKLHDQAVDANTIEAIHSMPESPSMQLLLPLLYMYELGAIAKGLNAYLNHTHVLREVIPEQNLVRVDVDRDNVIPDRTLIFSGEHLFKVANREVGTFEIKCIMRSQHQPQLFLRASEVPAWVYNQLQHDIPTLTPDDLSPGESQLHERLLNTSFPLLELNVRRLQSAVNVLGDRFVQAVALVTENPIEHVPALWREAVSHRFPYRDLPAESDPLYSEGVEQILARYRRYYPALRNSDIRWGIPPVKQA